MSTPDNSDLGVVTRAETSDKNVLAPVMQRLTALDERVTTLTDRGTGSSDTIKCETFSATPGEDPELWLKRLQIYADFREWNAEQFVSAFPMFLYKDAALWYDTLYGAIQGRKDLS